ncbi:MAG: hypothetical protein DME19_19285, partial [Verrucomicrobia bacterium]
SIVDRFLEHSRIIYFENGCQPEVFVGSADWMPRNFLRRIEVVFPIEDGILRERVKRELLEVPLADNVKARLLRPDGSYHRPAVKRARRCAAVKWSSSSWRFIVTTASSQSGLEAKQVRSTRGSNWPAIRSGSKPRFCELPTFPF